jgi:hypothetical protein
MSITAAGNVGIGTASPTTPLGVFVNGSTTTAAATYPGVIQICEQSITTLAQKGGLEFKTSIFGSGYGSKIVAFDDGSLVFAFRNNSATFTERVRFAEGGNVLIGTSTNSANGILQLTSHTTSAGGIGFGTDVTLYRSAANTLKTDDDLVVTGALSSTGILSGPGFRASKVTASSGLVKIQDEGANVYNVIGSRNNADSAALPLVFQGSNFDFLGAVAVTGALSSTGALAIGNTVNTVSPTSPNRTVTIVIGGTTYYLHAKTTND